MTTDDAIELLKELIAIPSFSRREDATAGLLFNYLSHRNIEVLRHFNNIYIRNRFFDPSKPVLLINSHHDTVQPNKDWSRDPFTPVIEGNRLFGLGSNDAGASLVSMLAAYLDFHAREEMAYNLIFLASAEEEVSGKDGVESMIPLLENIDCGIVGEPTRLEMAVAERGLMVVDCMARGRSGHAAMDEGDNAILTAIKDIEWVQGYEFPRVSAWLGKVKMTTTMIKAGTQHNVIPDECSFVLDIRSTDLYSNDQILTVLKEHMKSEIRARSTRLQPSFIPNDHPLVHVARDLGIQLTGSMTLSDQALMPFPTVKIGPGDSNRSHTADEYIFLNEVEEGIKIYTRLIGAMIGMNSV